MSDAHEPESNAPQTTDPQTSAEPPLITRTTGLDQLAALVVDDSQPSIVVLGGPQASGRQGFVRAVVEHVRGWDQPTRLLTLDLEGLEEDRLADYLEVQVAKRWRTLSERARKDGGGALVLAMLEVTGEQLVPVYNPTTLALVLSMALDTDSPVDTLRACLQVPPAGSMPISLFDPTLLGQSLRNLAGKGRVVVHLVDAELLPTVLSGTGAGILTWLALIAERQPEVTLVLSSEFGTPPETLIPYSRNGVHSIGWVSDGANRPELTERLAALRARLEGKVDGLDTLMELLVDAALCGPLVPVVPLLDRRGLDEAAREALEDALDDVLVAEDGQVEEGPEGPIFVDLEYTHPGFPTEGPDAVGPTYVYRFPDGQLRRALIESEDVEARQRRARAVLEALGDAYPPKTRTVARLRAHLSAAIDLESSQTALRELSWWVRPEEGPILDEFLTRALDGKILTAAEILAIARDSTHRPTGWRLTLLEACSADGGYHLESLNEEERLAEVNLREALRERLTSD